MHTAVVAPGFNLRAFGISPGWVPDFSNGLGHRFCAAFGCPKIKSGPCVSHIVRHSGPESWRVHSYN